MTKFLDGLALFGVLISFSFSAATSASLRSRQADVEGGSTATSSAATASFVRIGPPTHTARMHYMLRQLQKFKDFAEKGHSGVHERHMAEDTRLKAAVTQTRDEGVRSAVEQSLVANQRSLEETQRVYSNMLSFTRSMSDLLRAADTKGYSCEATTCGEHASCTDTTSGAQCTCHEGYVGRGQDCHAPPEFRPHRLIFEGEAGVATFARDMSVCTFGRNEIAVVFTDTSKGHVGRIVVGSVREAGMADLAPPEQFTQPYSRAFNPIVQGSDTRRLMVGWRDENRGGIAWIRGATLGSTGIRGAVFAMTWGNQVSIARDQAHRMALVSLTQNRFSVLFTDKVMATQHTPAEDFGNSVFAEVGSKGHISVLGKYRFSDTALCRLEVTKVTPTSFVVAARATRSQDEIDPSLSTRQEAVAFFGEAVGDDLAFGVNRLNMEPNRSQIWARGISLIAPYTLAYAYQDGSSQQIRMGVFRIDPSTRLMNVLHQPVTIRDGFSPYVSMLNVPYTAADPHTLVYYDGGNASMVSLCSWSVERQQLSGCEDFSWLASKPTSVKGVHLGGGKAFMVFSTEEGAPLYSVFGVAKRG
eukprot:TRINITY_DN74313_c0_g1_i1.p1 TRINITY_DN74313_c0_g1~~TRINITY_DN74313_c0_g1_i1.p1  ORF type:complete len:585 (+),score=84.98 TRINITY_DN74313_c0_g1_i1:72-1826(+)